MLTPFISGRARLASAGASVCFAIGGAFSMRVPPDVSTWADMEVVTSVQTDSTECGLGEPFPAVRSEFIRSDGKTDGKTVLSPAVPMGAKAVFPSFRLLDRDIGGTFHAQLRNDDGQTVDLADFTFSEGSFVGAHKGCRWVPVSVHLDSGFNPALARLESLVESYDRPTRWRLTQSVDIEGARSESWTSEDFWIVPLDTAGAWARKSVLLTDPFAPEGP